MWSGDHPGLQNRRTSVHPDVGAFDSHTLPPILSSLATLGISPRLRSGQAQRTPAPLRCARGRSRPLSASTSDGHAAGDPEKNQAHEFLVIHTKGPLALVICFP